ncbi:MAG: helix-turn-helix domain-containing protein [Pyrinomonadaceae bacterium]
MSEKFLKASEVAKKYDVNPYTVKSWIRSGLFPNAKFEETVAGSVWLIPESDLENFKKPEMGRPPKVKSEKDKNV